MSDEVKRKTELNLGELLQRARCNKNLTREQAARQLHIQPQILMLFEHNDFKQFNLPEHFIIEYLTNYASLLDLDAKAVAAIYRQGGVVDLAAAPVDKKPVTDLSVGVKSAVNHQRNNTINEKSDVKSPTRTPSESALSIANKKTLSNQNGLSYLHTKASIQSVYCHRMKKYLHIVKSSRLRGWLCRVKCVKQIRREKVVVH
ncbi:hypothetical protein Psal068_02071 [Piscirickettsia salmonis]|uniref:helix-turn-helix domain-containing protein n=1 Tax=Piscirickettsia salmonis TaxID=1238 RepID=UPI001E3EDBB8|nr:helix-turn-helix transcriptional regulator [Piscirickettsia salmonis]QGO49124.1 hypothetical protein Psal068_02071 [Piscirickettsia salmonis]